MSLGLSSRAGTKHLEMMYPKLGVEKRTAAVAPALAAARGAEVKAYRETV